MLKYVGFIKCLHVCLCGFGVVLPALAGRGDRYCSQTSSLCDCRSHSINKECTTAEVKSEVINILMVFFFFFRKIKSYPSTYPVV